MTEHKKAREWRERLNLTRQQLAELTGYSPESIFHFEKGLTPSRSWGDSKRKAKQKPIDPFVWQRYRRCCEAVELERETGRVFRW